MMENGYDGKFAEKFSGLAISNAADTIRSSNANHNHQNDSSLFQVMKAVEAAEATIKQQVEENLRLRTELQHKILELDRYKLDESMAQRSPSVDPWSEGLQTSFQAHQPVPTVDGQDNRIKSVRNTYVVLHQESQNPTTDAPIQSHAETQSNNGTVNGTMKLPTDNAGSSHLVFAIYHIIFSRKV
ncbi:hypothetical protein L3X38_026227 [Prunus dulcis]|uniref:Uncharacterized protein n=1 Tax=Prunus dulcis TaxID=3755 RepID=A0AAD4W3C4_PRUDU|nr:hypothetical protein L3X38_026227 [Prunus dulcis]